MIEQKFNLEKPQIEFLKNHQEYGFKNADEVVRTALQKLQLELESLEESAQLYAETYNQDPELQELTESALEGWPEL